MSLTTPITIYPPDTVAVTITTPPVVRLAIVEQLVVGGAGASTIVLSGDGITVNGPPGGPYTVDANFGSAGNTICEGSDPRLSDARTPTAHKSTHALLGSDPLNPADIGAATDTHGHGNISAAGTIGSLANRPLITRTGGEIVTGQFGTAANTFCEGNDARLALQTITLTGDVTGSGTGSFAATIPDDTVTYAKMQNVSAATRLLGRGSAAGAGDPQEITLGSGLIMGGTVLGWDRAALDDDYGDITVTGGGATWTIDNQSVTYAKMQHCDANRLLGRASGNGVIQEIVCTAAGRNLLDDADAAAQRTTLGVPTIYSGSTPPSAGTGVDGDLYFEY